MRDCVLSSQDLRRIGCTTVRYQPGPTLITDQMYRQAGSTVVQTDRQYSCTDKQAVQVYRQAMPAPPAV